MDDKAHAFVPGQPYKDTTMQLFWTIWAGVVVGLLLLASVIEINGARNGFVAAS